MKNKGVWKNAACSLAGLILLITGLVLVKSLRDPAGIMKTLPYLLVGIGSGVFGGNLSAVISTLALRSSPQAARQMEIEEKDERNTAIRNRAKAKAYDLMVPVFGALMLAFALMQVELRAVLSLVAAYLFVVFSSVYYLSRYQKEM